MPASQAAPKTCLVFRDKLLLPSEGFIPSHYVGFRELVPCYVANQLGWRAHILDAPQLITTGHGALGRMLYKQLGHAGNLAAIRAHNPVAIHAHFGRGGALALPLAKQLGIPLYVTFHGGDATKTTHQRRRVLPTIYQRRLAALQSYASGFLAVSDFVAERLRQQGFPAMKLRTHYIGLDLSAMTAPAKRSPQVPYLFVGRLVAKKGVDVLLRALQELRVMGHEPQLQIAGTGPDEGVLRAMAQGLDNVEFLGWQTPDQLARRWANCRGVIVPSREAPNGDCEGLPTVVLEALRAGAPVIATDHAGIPEIIRDNVTGILCPEADATALAHAIHRHMTTDDGIVMEMVTAGQHELRSRFDAHLQSSRLETLLMKPGL